MTQEQLNERMISILEENLALNRRQTEALEKIAVALANTTTNTKLPRRKTGSIDIR